LATDMLAGQSRSL